METDGVRFTLSIKDDFPEVEAAVRKVVADMLGSVGIAHTERSGTCRQGCHVIGGVV